MPRCSSVVAKGLSPKGAYGLFLLIAMSAASADIAAAPPKAVPSQPPPDPPPLGAPAAATKR